ncbi:hypothetical protein [Hwangdonia seohaensis]|uniref:Sigma-70 family RNA polymerase sigma factor n=1 Tax=Hwangdonia seohaensis TaxID=1240727 RepID=A0ABW3RA59_9FLAO|nr:hypothetical protein [Hwangdonia seohaensis]
MCSTDKLNDKTTIDTFNKKVVSATQHLQSYIKHRLYIAESKGIIPKNMYASNDFTDEAIAKFYEGGYDVDMDAFAIKIKLFKIVDSDLNELFEKEAFHQHTLSTNDILEEELDGLEELFTVDEDFDFIMNEELNDISYKQDHKHKPLFIYDNDDISIQNALEVEDMSALNNKNILGKFYTLLPLKVSEIVDLFVFGRLDYDEVAEIKNIEAKRVKRILNLTIESLKERLG